MCENELDGRSGLIALGVHLVLLSVKVEQPGSVGQLDGSGRWLVEFQLPVEHQLAVYQLAEYQLEEHQLEEFHLSPWNHYSAVLQVWVQLLATICLSAVRPDY